VWVRPISLNAMTGFPFQRHGPASFLSKELFFNGFSCQVCRTLNFYFCKTDFVALLYAFCRVYTKYPSLLAEMYAYSMAAAHTNLPHFTLLNLMVSNVHAGDEGWKWIDALEDNVCEDRVFTAGSSGAGSKNAPSEAALFYPNNAMPSVLHYCQFYRAGEFGFQKRRIKKEMFQCDHPMMAKPPKDLGKINYKNRDGEVRVHSFSPLKFLFSYSYSYSYFWGLLW
jgi:hypothetical protein